MKKVFKKSVYRLHVYRNGGKALLNTSSVHGQIADAGDAVPHLTKPA